MDDRVNDFLNEINEIAPLSKKEENVWEKCYDDDSGCYYYWNIQTNEVTWEMPADYKTTSKPKAKSKTVNLYIPPRTTPLFPSTSQLPSVTDAIKIYKIGESAESTISKPKIKHPPTTIVKTETLPNPKEVRKRFQAKSKPPRKKGDSDDERIVLISSYGGDTDESSEEDNALSSKKQNGGGKKFLDLVESEKKSVKDIKLVVKSEPKSISGFSLLAGYNSDSNDENSELEEPPLPPKTNNQPEEPKITHSTLFPFTKPINVSDFVETEPKPEVGEEVAESSFDSKAFQRKKRIGVALVNTGKKSRGNNEESERKGLGFGNESGGSGENDVVYGGFKVGGVMFVKSDVLNPINPVVEEKESSNDDKGAEEQKTAVISKDIEESYSTLKEKLAFLSEGRDAVSPVQIMLIQIETLITALKSGHLRESYLEKWLNETCSDLVKLEKEATPEGWLLQWDRSHKRYYYQNEATGETQWEYPDVTRCDEAMDICTTPPPHGAEPSIHTSPPLPPNISSPSPPPPPIISATNGKIKTKSSGKEGEAALNPGEPLPPGVDPPAEIPPPQPKEPESSKDADLTDVLSSFYSDIAAIETSNSPPIPPSSEEAQNLVVEAQAENAGEPAKKKKKSKVKLDHGIAMKKKGVSKLVEKWKNVQMSYND